MDGSFDTFVIVCACISRNLIGEGYTTCEKAIEKMYCLYPSLKENKVFHEFFPSIFSKQYENFLIITKDSIMQID